MFVFVQESGCSEFPAQHLATVYFEKRNRMKAQVDEWRRQGWIDTETEPPLLLIDIICATFGRNFKVSKAFLCSKQFLPRICSA